MVTKGPKLEKAINKVMEDEEMAMQVVKKNLNFDKLEHDIWLGDSGASSHMTNDSTGMYNMEEIKGGVVKGDGSGIAITHQGKLDVFIHQKDGTKVAKTLVNVKLDPKLEHSLFSLMTVMLNGWELKGKWVDKQLTVNLTKKGEEPIVFDQKIQSGSTLLIGLRIEQRVVAVNMATVSGVRMMKQKFHQVLGHLGHCGAQVLGPTTEKLGLILTGGLKKCENCPMEKIRKANIAKESGGNKATEPGGQFYLDMASMKHNSLGGRKHWVLMVDKYSDFKKSIFLKKKNDQVEPIVEWIKELKTAHRISVKYIRCDNSGENQIFEFTALGTPQQKWGHRMCVPYTNYSS
ncbi:hypothetical protein ACA910_014675 [Epithemia clementina (nom. ined.)]